MIISGPHSMPVLILAPLFTSYLMLLGSSKYNLIVWATRDSPIIVESTEKMQTVNYVSYPTEGEGWIPGCEPRTLNKPQMWTSMAGKGLNHLFRARVLYI
ncbi:hypothetical protein CDAR_271801 [Caerostris darwini]|uniref:Uncharacterized protein n=1 Tax=Caerostris darwini TaxID=1538125 RepID=A0AAV4SZ73_9ARAC|nr:hypothetical protein CDAR_271801 [Caerostris darwini]